MKGSEVVGHVAHKISRMCAVFKTGRYIKCNITGNFCYSYKLSMAYYTIAKGSWKTFTVLLKTLQTTKATKL